MSSALPPCKIHLWPKFQPKPGSGDRAIRSFEPQFPHACQSKPGESDLAIKPQKLELWRGFRPKPEAGDIAIESSMLEL